MQARATLSVICLDSLYLAQTPVIRYVSALCGVRYKHNTLIDNNSHSAKLRGEIEREREAEKNMHRLCDVQETCGSGKRQRKKKHRRFRN